MKRENDYRQVGKNVYYNGSSYRVRVSVNGIRMSKNFTTKKDALAYRRQLLEQQESFYR